MRLYLIAGRCFPGLFNQVCKFVLAEIGNTHIASNALANTIQHRRATFLPAALYPRSCIDRHSQVGQRQICERLASASNTDPGNRVLKQLRFPSRRRRHARHGAGRSITSRSPKAILVLQLRFQYILLEPCLRPTRFRISKHNRYGGSRFRSPIFTAS